MKREKSSSISAKRAFEQLLANGYEVVKDGAPTDIKSTVRKLVKEAQSMFGPNVSVSNSGKSVYVRSISNPDTVIHMPFKDMLTEGTVAAIEKTTGLKLSR